MDILVIDDDPRCRQALGQLLNHAGFDVVAELEDGAEAIAFLEQIRVDAIITDCQMPRMDGLSLTRRLRALRDTTPIVMVSGHQGAAIVHEAFRAGVSAFFPKPLDGRSLIQFLLKQSLLAA